MLIESSCFARQQASELQEYHLISAIVLTEINLIRPADLNAYCYDASIYQHPIKLGQSCSGRECHAGAEQIDGVALRKGSLILAVGFGLVHPPPPLALCTHTTRTCSRLAHLSVSGQETLHPGTALPPQQHQHMGQNRPGTKVPVLLSAAGLEPCPHWCRLLPLLLLLLIVLLLQDQVTIV